MKKYRGEEGERLAVLPLLQWLGDKNSSNRDGTVIVGQKSTLELFQQEIERELANSTNPPSEPVDGKIAVLEKLAESAGLDLDVQQIEQETENLIAEYFGSTRTTVTVCYEEQTSKPYSASGSQQLPKNTTEEGCGHTVENSRR